MTQNTGKTKTKKVEEELEVRPPMPPPPEPEAGEEGDAIRISDSVIAAVVRKYTLDVNGVIRFATGSIVGGIADMIGRKSRDSSVVVDHEGDTVSISVTLVVEFGVKIPEVASLVQDVIRTKVEELTGQHVQRVNVTVQDLEEKQAEQPEAAPPASAEEGD